MDLPEPITLRCGMPPYFNDQPLHAARRRDPMATMEYVLWVDIMGMQNIMRGSMSRTANFAAKLVMAAEDAVRDRPRISLRPVIDGAFLHGADVRQFRSAANRLFARLAMICVKAGQARERLIVRGGMAHGVVVRGDEIPGGCFFQDQRPHRVGEVIFGPGVSEAYGAAETAPPFGVNVHSSAADILTGRGGHPATRQWRWWVSEGSRQARELSGYLKYHVEKYYEWCEQHPVESGYRPDRLTLHRATFREHYIDVETRVPEQADAGE